MSDKDLRLLDENSSLLPEPKNDVEREVRKKLKGMACTYGPMRKSAGGVVQPFPGKVSASSPRCFFLFILVAQTDFPLTFKLMEVLDRSDLLDIICWMPHGRAFIVKKPKLFAVDILPRFFKQTKYLSFTRQLNLWGFKRITKGLDGGAYYHELFLRGRPYLAMRMKRHKVKGTGIKLTPNPKDEPLFYKDYPYMDQFNEARAMKPLPPLPPDRVGFPDQESSQGAPGAGGGRVGIDSTQKLQHQQLQQMGQYQFPHATPNMMGTPYLTSSQAGPLLEVPSFLHNRPSHYSDNYASLSHHMSSMRPRSNPLSSSPLMGGAVSTNPVSYRHQARNYENVLFAPGVTWGSVPTSSRVNDPIQDELNAMIRSRQAGSNDGGMFPSQNLTSDRLLMESLRDMDRAAQLKREQQDISMFGRGGASPSSSAFSAPMRSNNFAFSGPSISNGLGNGPFDRYRQIGSQTGAFGCYQGYGFGPTVPSAAAASALTSTMPVTGQDGDNLENDSQVVESSVKEALREANHLEKLALAQRAKARNIALAGALKLKLSSRMGSSTPSLAAKEGGQASNESEDQVTEGALGSQFGQDGMQYAV
jgi:hypothetical protein